MSGAIRTRAVFEIDGFVCDAEGHEGIERNDGDVLFLSCPLGQSFVGLGEGCFIWDLFFREHFPDRLRGIWKVSDDDGAVEFIKMRETFFKEFEPGCFVRKDTVEKPKQEIGSEGNGGFLCESLFDLVLGYGAEIHEQHRSCVVWNFSVLRLYEIIEVSV